MSERQLGETTALTPARSDRVVTGIFLSLQRSLGNVFLYIWPEVPDYSVFGGGGLQEPENSPLLTSRPQVTKIRVFKPCLGCRGGTGRSLQWNIASFQPQVSQLEKALDKG